MKCSKDIFPRDKRAPADIVYGFSGGAEKIYSVHRKPASQGDGFMGLAPADEVRLFPLLTQYIHGTNNREIPSAR